jgi:hypothetical protein
MTLYLSIDEAAATCGYTRAHLFWLVQHRRIQWRYAVNVESLQRYAGAPFRPSSKLAQAVRWIEAHPGSENERIVPLARRMASDGLRVSPGTAHKARRYVRGEAGR